MQLWPELLNPVAAHRTAAASTSASSQTMVAALPPSSSTSRFGPAARDTAAPAAALPVKLTADTTGDSHTRPPTSAPPWTTCTASGGIPASSNTWTSRVETAGACGGGLTIVVLPAAKEAASLWVSRFAGALNGVIAATTPTGA